MRAGANGRRRRGAGTADQQVVLEHDLVAQRGAGMRITGGRSEGGVGRAGRGDGGRAARRGALAVLRRRALGAGVERALGGVGG